MAIRYPGDKNLIGYGAAQVFKPIDTSNIEKEKDRGERARVRKAKAAAAKKAAADKALSELLKENDLSKVRNADIDYLTNEFDDIIKQAGAVVRNGGNPATDLKLQRRLNEYRSNTAQSALGRERYDANLKLVTENDDYKGNENVARLQAENQAAMFGDGASYFEKEGQGEEGTEGYVAPTSGAQISRLTPNLHVEKFYKEQTENIKPQAITMTQDGKFTLPASGGNYLTFETKKEATDAQLELAAKDILANHPYSEDFRADQERKAIDAGFKYIDPDTQEEVADVLSYVKNQVASRVGEVDMTGVKEIRPRGTYVSLSTAEEQKAASGESIAPTSYEMPGTRNVVSKGILGFGAGKIVKEVQQLSYPIVDIPAVLDNEGNVITPKRTGQTFDFGGKPFNVSPEEDAGFMVFGQSQEASDAGLNPGFSRSGQNIEFIPKSITFKPTATQDLEVEVDGVKQQFSKGEPLDQAAIDALSEKDREKLLENKPWLEGLEKYGTTLSIAFSPNVHRRFSTHVSFQNKRDRAIYERIMRNIGIEPIKEK